jgi:pimeloyl-ACP methyl ester carboxylesterase
LSPTRPALYVDRAKFRDLFCKDLSVEEADVAAATQKPTSGSVFSGSVARAAWKTVPSWYIVSSQDQALNPDLERFYAKRMGAKITEIQASHASFLSRPGEVAKVIEEASGATQ